MPEKTMHGARAAFRTPEVKVVVGVNIVVWMIFAATVLPGSDVLAAVIGVAFLCTPAPPWRWRWR